ncbi:hypothetical protein OENI_510005 [Oenococcus oeni]|nr:hypothetical protein OENI_510005 [Oenococcus oeni]
MVSKPQIMKITGIMHDLFKETGLSTVSAVPRLIKITKTTHTQKGVL